MNFEDIKVMSLLNDDILKISIDKTDKTYVQSITNLTSFLVPDKDYSFASILYLQGQTTSANNQLVNLENITLTTTNSDSTISTFDLDITTLTDSNGNKILPYGLLSAGNVHDEINSNAIIRRVGYLDLGSLTWKEGSSSTSPYAILNEGGYPYSGLFTFSHPDDFYIHGSVITSTNKRITFSYDGWLYYKNDDYTAETLPSFLQGKYLTYELANPIYIPLKKSLLYKVEKSATTTSSAEITARITYKENITTWERPEGLIFYDYLESTGTLYIDTGYIPNLDTSLYTHIYIKDANGKLDFFGSSKEENGYSYGFYDGGSYVYDNYGNDICLVANHISGDCVINKIKNLTTVTGDVSAEYTHSEKTFESINSLYLYARHLISSGYRPSRIKMYYCKIYDGDTLVRYFLPCTYQGVPGMWDIVENKFYGNSGTGTFIVGTEPWRHYVLDGLIFMLDIDSLSDKSTWKDLTGNYGEFSFDESKGIVAHDNYVEFLGITGGYIDTGTLFGLLNDMTIEICYKANSSATYASVFSAMESGNLGFLASNSLGTLVFAVGNPSGGYYTNLIYKSINNVLYTLSGATNTTTGKITLCGNKELVSLVTGYTTTRYNTYNFQIGTDAGSTVGFDGNIYSIRVYNRGLSVEEMKRNESLDIKRFKNI